MKYLIAKLPRAILRSIIGRNFFWHMVAIVATIIIVNSGLDWLWFISTRSSPLLAVFRPAISLGGTLPFIVPLCLIIGGYLLKKKEVIMTGWLIGQAAIVGGIISSFYKVFTGRIQPNLHDTVNDISHNFNFGFLRHGIFWGWPSTHTTIAFAMAFCFIVLFPKMKVAGFIVFIYAFYVGIGVSMSIHWFSEFVAGAIMGTVIGITVANLYKKSIV